LIRHLAVVAVGAPALRRQLGDQGGALVGVAVQDAGDGALSGKAPGDGLADPLGATRDEDDLVLESQVHGEAGGGCPAAMSVIVGGPAARSDGHPWRRDGYSWH